MKNGLIPKYSISDDTGNVINANNARLDGNVTEKPYGWQGKWLQIDLSSLFKVANQKHYNILIFCKRVPFS